MIQQAFEMLNHADRTVRQAGQQRLIAAGYAGIVTLREAVRDPSSRISFSAAQALAQVEDPWRFESMAAVLRSRNPLVGEVAARALANYGEGAVETLTAALRDCHILVQLRIVHSLEEISSRQAVPPLLAVLASTGYVTLRYLIIQALGVIGDPAAIPLITTFAHDPDYHVRERVKIALQRLGAAATNPATSGKEH
jgi:HEAT repeat protein